MVLASLSPSGSVERQSSFINESGKRGAFALLRGSLSCALLVPPTHEPRGPEGKEGHSWEEATSQQQSAEVGGCGRGRCEAGVQSIVQLITADLLRSLLKIQVCRSHLRPTEPEYSKLEAKGSDF